MNRVISSARLRSLGLTSLIALVLSLAFLSLSALLPRLLIARNPQKSLGLLRHQAQLIKKEFAAIESGLQARQKSLAVSSFPYDKDKIFALFKGQGINPDLEGLAYYDEDGSLAVWLGNVIEFRPPVLERPLLVRSRASSFLVTSARIRQSEQIVLFRLLAFRPQLQAPFLSEYQFLDRNLRKNGHVDYWDFREDVSGFEQIFARHNDEYRGEPRQDSETQQIFFPLRNERNEIVATVNLTAPPLRSVHSRLREAMVFFSLVFLALALIFLIADLARSILRSARPKTGPIVLQVLAIGALRLVFVPFSRLQKVQSLRVFSPTEAGFFSVGRLTQSPADILLSTLCLFLIIFTLARYAWSRLRERKRRLPLAAVWAVNTALSGAVLAAAVVYHGFISRLVANSNLNLLRFSSQPSFLFLHLGVVFFLLSCGCAAFLGCRIVHLLSPRLWAVLPPLIWTPGALFCLGRSESGRILVLIPFLAFALGYLILASSTASKKRAPVFALIFLVALLNSFEIHLQGSARLGSLAQNFLRQTILSQEDWADFIIQQSLPEIEKRNTFILAFLQNPDPSPFARELWESTLAAKFNWYSILEVLDAEGRVTSRFSLNISQLYQPEMELPLSPTWRVSRVSVPSLGKERDFALAYKDWYSQDRYLGRVTFSLALDPEMLPFLYSANPYFELLKVSLLPSLNEQKFGFAIFDAQGKILFNPSRISSGIGASALELVNRFPEGMWSSFRDKGQSYRAFLFTFQNRVYAFFIPKKNLMGLTVEFLKLAVFYLGLVAVILVFVPVLAGRKKPASYLWSFSSRVNAAFVTITVISLLLFTFFSHRFFTRTFSQRFQQAAEVQANFARNIMQDFIALQQEERATLIAPTDDLVLWISSAIATDVNLYGEGRLISSSRREFFDWGFLPEIIDGEAYFRIEHENRPFYIQRPKIGGYSYQSLTIPYAIRRTEYLISLPFPFEAQEIAGATEELVEFLVFVSAFLILFVLLFARGIGRMIISPVNKLLAGTKEVSLGNLEIAVEHRSHDEMKSLVDGFNTMIKDLKRHQQEIADLSKKVASADMAQRVAHEIKNPLTPIQLSAEHILRVYEDRSGDFEKALRESVSYIISEVDNLRRIAQEFLELSRVSSLAKESFDLREAVGEVVSPYRQVISERIRIREVFEGREFPLEADKSKIKIAFRNIFINAIEAIRGRGEIEIRLRAEKDSLVLIVRDSGTGMAKDMVEKIFDPYFSTKDAGTGLGLPIAKKIVEDHGGAIRVESEVQKGTTITITLPRKSERGSGGKI
jgi:signal transduction histidine kinase